MLQQYFRRSRVRARIEANLLGPALVRLTSELGDRGYALGTIQVYVQAAEHFGAWLSLHGVAIARVTPALIAEFLDSRDVGVIPRDAKTVRAALRHLLRVLTSMGLVWVRTLDGRSALSGEMGDFRRHMETTCGLATATCNYRIRYAAEFLAWKFGGRRLNSAALRPSDFVDYLRTRALGLKPQSVQVIASSLRCYLKWLELLGRADERLKRAVPGIPCWRLATLPRLLSDKQVAGLLKAFDLSTASGLRDHAMALCFLELGLRAGEVARIELEDIDWRGGILRIGESKTRRGRVLPLPRRTGRAIAAYLRKGRPDTTSQSLFVRHRVPLGQPMVAELVRGAMRRAYAKAGCPADWTGTHLLRHTAATRMIEGGASLKQIADVLGHQSIDSTMIYTKVDLPALRRVSLPWPEGRP